MSQKRNIRGINGIQRYDGKEPPPIAETTKLPPSKVWKKKYPCKKNKGEHTPVIELIKYCGRGWRQEKDGTWVKERNYWGKEDQTYGWVLWVCTGCRKHFTEFRVPDKKFDKWRT